MPVKLTRGITIALEIYLDSMDDFDGLCQGLRLIMWTYLEDHIDDGVDAKITGNFLKNFDSLLELIWIIHEEEKK